MKTALPSSILALALALPGCGTSFAPASLVESVRILAISADKPYAAPGDTVTMTALAYDGRASQPAPMQVFWVPVVCPDPPGDSYFACYPGFATFAKALPPGVPLSSVLTAGSTFQLEMPENVITAHASPAYGMVVVFAIACAGQVQLVDRGQDTVPPAPPLGCFDGNGAELGPDDSVFAYAQVYAFADGRTNQNPIIQNLTFAGAAVDPTQGITVEHCPTTGKCSSTALDTVVPQSSDEPDPGDLNASGTSLHEEVWVDYYLTAGSDPAAAGSVGGSALLYDATAGKIKSSSVQLTPPSVVGDQFLWAVVHDNRGGVAWQGVTVRVQ